METTRKMEQSIQQFLSFSIKNLTSPITIKNISKTVVKEQFFCQRTVYWELFLNKQISLWNI